MRRYGIVFLALMVSLLILLSPALAIECTADSTKTITMGQPKNINVQCSGIALGGSVTVTHTGYNQNCLTTSKDSASLTQANPSATFSFDALSTACDSNPSGRTVTWNFNDGSNVYQDTTAVTIESYAITATLSGDLSATVGSSVIIIMTVTNIGNKDVNSVSIEETTSTGLLSGKSISSISAQSSQAVSWTFAAPSAGTYNLVVKADSATTDPASDSFTLTVTSAGSGGSSDGDSPSISGSFPLAVSPDEDNVTNESIADDDSDELICAQVITPAQNPETGECREFPTPCDVPEGWVTVDSCPSVDTDLTGNLVDEIPSDEKKPSTPVIIFFVGIIAVIGFVVYHYVIANRKAAMPPSSRPSSSSPPLSPPRSSSSIPPVPPPRSSSSIPPVPPPRSSS